MLDLIRYGLLFGPTCLDANITGYALVPDTTQSHYFLLNLPVHAILSDIWGLDTVRHSLRGSRLDIVWAIVADQTVNICGPQWQYVLEPLEQLQTPDQRLLEAENGFIHARNIDPSDEGIMI